MMPGTADVEWYGSMASGAPHAGAARGATAGSDAAVMPRTALSGGDRAAARCEPAERQPLAADTPGGGTPRSQAPAAYRAPAAARGSAVGAARRPARRGGSGCGLRHRAVDTAADRRSHAPRSRLRYHFRSLGLVLHARGWTPQRPPTQAKERDEALITAWLKRDWPRIKRGLEEQGPSLPS